MLFFNHEFLNKIERTYGQATRTDLRSISKLYQKLAKQKNRRIFLLRCKHTNTIPVFLKFNVNHISFKGTYLGSKFNNIIHDAQYKILDLTITETTKTINELFSQINNNINKVANILPGKTLNDFLTFENSKYEKTFTYIKTKNQKKIKALMSKTTNINNNIKINTTDWVHNISNTEIPDDITEILALGEKYSLPITSERRLPVSDYIASVESIISDKSTEIKDSIRANVVNVITNHITKIKHKKQKQKKFQKNTLQQFKKAKQFLKENPQIKVLKPDKSNKTVIMDSTEYNLKINELLKDTTTYKKLKIDPTNSFQNKNNNFVKKLLNKSAITDVEAKNLIIHNAVSPKIYGLPKIHKDGCPLRPIVSCIQSPFYKLSKFLSNSLSKITCNNNFYIKDSFDFKQFIDTIKIPINHKLISLDVVSLYTNIPITLISDILTKKWVLLKQHTSLTLDDFINAVNLVLNNSYFQYENDFFQQLNGCAMGSPISSTIAQLVMEHLEETTINNLDFDITFFKRYVDDCLTSVPENKINEILTAFNDFHPSLQFTIETEKNNEINFLDLTLIRNVNENNIKTKWYTKKTWSGRYLNYNSNHPNKQKRSVVIGLTDRAIALTSPEFRPEILKKVKQTLLNNHFPEKLITRIVKQRIHVFYNKTKKHMAKIKPQNNKYIALPYTEGMSEKIKYILAKHNITVCYRAQNLVKSLFSPLKMKIPEKKKSNVVYAIPCLNCPKKYIGMTTQLLNNRLNGHKYTKNASTALHKHESQTNHEFNFNETKILVQETNYQKLTVREMIEIKREKEAVNDKKDIGTLSQIYYNLINT